VATDKRARKKQARDARQAARLAALRRRRLIRLTAAVVVIAVLFALAFTVGGSDPKKTTPTSKRDDKTSTAPSPNDTETAKAGGVACGAKAPPKANPKQYDKPPANVLETGVDYGAVIHTSCGDIKLDLLEAQAPETVNNFVALSKDGFYDGLTWHRIVGNFVIQGGDPEGTGAGGPGYSFGDELPAKSNVYVFGAVAMANSGPDTNGSQFFIVTHTGPDGDRTEPAGLTPDYSYFGQVDKSSFGVVDEIGKLPTQGGDDPNAADRPLQTVYIESIDITEG
jgi:cyclophilin family peptidyl-prolyl cis-trans isomerase